MTRLARLHLWLGLATGGFLAVISASGVLLLFSPRIEQKLHANLFEIPPQNGRSSLDAVLRRVRDEYPGARIKSFHFARGPDHPHMLWLRDERDRIFKRVFVNPHTGAVLGSLAKPESVHRWLNNLHYKFFSGLPGTVLVCALGGMLIVLSITGLALYWRAHGSFLPNRVRWFGPAAERNRDLHHLIGLGSALTNIGLAATGIWIAGSEVAATLALPGPEVIDFPEPVHSIDLVVRRANEALPELRPEHVRLPETARDPIRVAGRVAGHPFLSATIEFDFATAEIRRMIDDRRAPISTRLTRYARPLHEGSYGGLSVRILYAIAGLAPLALVLTRVANLRRGGWRAPRRMNGN